MTQTDSEPGGIGLPITADRLMDAYASALQRYLVAESDLAEASSPVPPELVWAHHQAAEDFRTIRGIFAASAVRSEAVRATEAWRGAASE